MSAPTYEDDFERHMRAPRSKQSLLELPYVLGYSALLGLAMYFAFTTDWAALLGVPKI